MSFVDDRWFRKITGPDGKVTQERSARHGKGMRYRARYLDPDGRERSRSFPDGQKKQAAAWADDAESDVRRGTWTDPDAGRTTLRRFAEDVYLPGLTSNITTQERIAATLRLHILPALGAKPLGYLAAHPSVIQQWVRGLKLAPSSAGVVLSVLGGVLSAALDDGIIQRNPCRGGKVRPPAKPDRVIVPWKASRVAAVREHMEPRYRATVDAGAGLGLRQGEMFGFSPGDVDWLRGIVRVRRQVKIAGNKPCFAPPKGGKEREVVLGDLVKEPLAAHVAAFPPVTVTLPWCEPDGRPVTVSLMFSTASGKHLRRSDYNRHHWAPAIKAAGLAVKEGNGFHALRHRFASVALAAGADIRRLSAWLGHHDPGFTLRTYCHLMPEGDARIRRALDEVMRSESDGPVTDREAGSGTP
jgi:integrase